MDRIVIEAKDELFLKNIHDTLVGSKLNFSIPFDYGFIVEVPHRNYECRNIPNPFLNNYMFEVYEIDTKDFLYSFEISWSNKNHKILSIDRGIEHSESSVQIIINNIESFKVMFAMFCHVMSNYEQFNLIDSTIIKKEVVDESKVKKTTKRINPKKKKKYKNQSLIKIIDYNRLKLKSHDLINKTIRENKPREWHVDEFTRRGHWRTYKSGKKVWIKPIKVITGANTGIVSDKIFKL